MRLPSRASLLWVGGLIALTLIQASPAAADEAPIRFIQSEDRLEIRAGEKPIAVYVYRDEKIPRPYFAHLFAPAVVQVSRQHPPREGADAADHALMHPGMWLAFGDLSGADSWRLAAPVRFQGFESPPASSGDAGRFTVRLGYMAADENEPIARERCDYRILNTPAGYLFLSDSVIEPEGEEIVFGDQEEMGLGFRLATGLTVQAGGELTNSHGQKGEKYVWGKTALWCNYQGRIGDWRAGVLAAPHPENFRPSWFHVRDYGLLVANPFGRKAFGAGEASQVVVRRGESLRLRFAVLLHSRPADQPFDAAAAHKLIERAWAPDR